MCARARELAGRRGGENKEAREGRGEEEEKNKQKSKPGSRGGGHRAREKNTGECIWPNLHGSPISKPERGRGIRFRVVWFRVCDGLKDNMCIYPA